jgi:hypothetical protein
MAAQLATLLSKKTSHPATQVARIATQVAKIATQMAILHDGIGSFCLPQTS